MRCAYPYMDAPVCKANPFIDDDSRSRLQPYIRSLVQPLSGLLTHDEIRWLQLNHPIVLKGTVDTQSCCNPGLTCGCHQCEIALAIE
jgi:hypothetical protein